MIEYTIDVTQRLIKVHMSGRNTCDDLAKHYARVISDPGYDPTLDTLFMVAADTDMNVSETGKLRMLQEVLAEKQQSTKWALVLPRGFKGAMARFALDGLNLKSVTMRFFDDEESAAAWLNSGKTSSSTQSRPTPV